MKELTLGAIHDPALRSAGRLILLLMVLAGTVAAQESGNATKRDNPQKSKEPYPSMAPLDQYLIKDQESELALARSAAPPSISNDAEILVLTSSALPDNVRRFHSLVNGGKDLYWSSEGTQSDYYDQESYVTKAAEIGATHFRTTLM